MDLYQANILEHYKKPQHFGKLKKPTHSADHGNALCGDTVRFDLVVQGGKIKEVAWMGEGCVLSQATASILADAVINKTPAQVKKLSAKQITRLLKIEVGPNRINCATLSLDTIQKALFK